MFKTKLMNLMLITVVGLAVHAIGQDVVAPGVNVREHGVRVFRQETRATQGWVENEREIPLVIRCVFQRPDKNYPGEFTQWMETVPPGQKRWFRVNDTSALYIYTDSFPSKFLGFMRLSGQHKTDSVPPGGTSVPEPVETPAPVAEAAPAPAPVPEPAPEVVEPEPEPKPEPKKKKSGGLTGW